MSQTHININDCWLYAGTIGTHGYGVFNTTYAGKKRVSYRIHRLMYENENGDIPKELVIDHLCRVKQCVNPTHLEAVTQQENTLRGDSSMSRRARQTHCLRGHEYTQENTRYTKQGWRSCKTCWK